MTEQEWLKGTQPRRMLDHIIEKASTRKRLLFSCASCRRVWDRINDDRGRHGVEIAEQFADGLVPAKELLQASEAAERACIAGEDATARAIRAAYAASWHQPWAVNEQLLPGKRIRDRKLYFLGKPYGSTNDNDDDLGGYPLEWVS